MGEPRCGEAEQAVAVYRGPFLDGFYLDGEGASERWVESTCSRGGRRRSLSKSSLRPAIVDLGECIRREAQKAGSVGY